jgi:hypothetical protein
MFNFWSDRISSYLVGLDIALFISRHPVRTSIGFGYEFSYHPVHFSRHIRPQVRTSFFKLDFKLSWYPEVDQVDILFHNGNFLSLVSKLAYLKMYKFVLGAKRNQGS